jgi:hypothetical protein
MSQKKEGKSKSWRVKIPTFFDWENVDDGKSLEEVADEMDVASNLFDNGNVLDRGLC